MSGEKIAFTQNKRITAGIKARFGVADFGLSILVATMQFYMLFYYTDVAKIDPGIAGTAMLVGKLTWDMINDVLIGYLSDRTKSRWGRRRPYLILCAVPLCLTFWLLFSLPEGMSNVTAFFAVIGTFLLYDTFCTFVTMAYYAMTAELTLDYDERTGLTTIRMIYNSIGYILGAAITPLLAGILQNALSISVRAAYSYIGLLFGFIAMVTVLITGVTVRLKPVIEAKPSTLPPVKAVLNTLKNKPFLRYVVIQALISIAFTLVTTMLPYFIIYQLQMESVLSLVMMALLVTITIFLVPCQKVTGRLGKANTYALGLTVACAAMIVAFCLPHGSTWIIYAVAVVAGIGFSSQWICPHSMMPDVIEYDELLTGERREGIFYGINAMIGKITGALGIAICGWGLRGFGYVEGATQTATSLFGIKLMFALLPIALLLACVPLLLKYPITREGHAKIVEQLDAIRTQKNETEI